MYPGYAKDSPARFHEALRDISVQRVTRVRALGNALNRAIGHQDRLYLAMRRFAPNGGHFPTWLGRHRASGGVSSGSARMCLNSIFLTMNWSSEITHIATRKDINHQLSR